MGEHLTSCDLQSQFDLATFVGGGCIDGNSSAPACVVSCGAACVLQSETSNSSDFDVCACYAETCQYGPESDCTAQEQIFIEAYLEAGCPDLSRECSDTDDDEFKDNNSNGCQAYYDDPSMCGDADNADFVASDQCCICGGGIWVGDADGDDNAGSWEGDGSDETGSWQWDGDGDADNPGS